MKTHNIHNYIATRLFVLMVALLSMAPAFAQESQQHAIYNYRNDGQFNAWLNIDVEKITYSCTDLDGVEHDDIVVQEVWTPDSVYRIPINAIDSIGFRAPKPELKDGIFHITENHLPYAVSVEDLTVTFSSSIPSSMLPSIGQVVISDVFDSPFEEGFSGKVESISNNNGQITIICSEAALNDVFKKLVLVGKGVSEDDANSKATNMRGAPRKAWTDPLVSFEGQGIYSNIEIPTDLNLNLLGGILNVTSKKPSLTISYCFYIDDLIYSFSADAYLNHKDLSFKIAFKLSDFLKVAQGGSEYLTNFILGKGDEEKAEKEWYEQEFDKLKLKIPFNIGPVIFSLELAPVFKLNGDVELDLITKTSARQHIGFTKSGSTPSLIRNPLVALALPDLKYGYAQDPVSVQQLTAKAEGSATMGISLQLKAYVLHKNLIQASIGAEYDREAKGTIQLNLYDTENQPTSFYDVIKDTKVEVKDYVKIKGEIGTLKYLTLDGSFKIPVKEWGSYNIVPHFTKPELPAYTNGVWTFRNPFSLYSTVLKDVLVSCKPGLRIEDVDGNLEKEYTSTEPYRYEVAWELTPLEIDISDLTPDKTYKCYPTFRMLDIKTFKATPVAEFTVPQPVSLETTTITVQKDKAQNVAINGGWGDYSVIVLDKSVCTAELKQDGNSYYIQIVGKKDNGSTSVTVKDLRSQKTTAILVMVSEQQATASSCPDNHHPHMIDLGLPSGTKWACCNVGAQNPEDYGGYYAWGETTEKGSYTSSNYLDGKSTDYDIGNDIASSQYDAATANWGSSWVMPNKDQMDELNYCTSEWTTQNGVNGLRFTSPNGASIFFPAAGDRLRYELRDDGSSGYYWSSTLHESQTSGAWGLDFNSVNVHPNYGSNRYFGHSVRPVMSEVVPVYPPLQFSQEQLSIVKGSSTSVEITSGCGEYEYNLSNDGIVSVSISGSTVTINALQAGQTTVTIVDTKSNQTATIEVTVTAGSDIPSYTSCPDSHHPHLIDLGLPSGTKWACCNVGASKPEDYGGYYAWGEITEKSSYTWANYLDGKGTDYYIGNDIAGTQYDAATANWGSSWVMPSLDQVTELLDNCTSEWTIEKGVNGRKFTGSNRASIFLPAAGYRWNDSLYYAGSQSYYWSSSLTESNPNNAYELYFSRGYAYWDDYERRDGGHSVRPVVKN